MQQVREMAQPPLLNTSAAGEDSVIDQNLDTLIDAVCKVVSFYEMVSNTITGSELHAVLTANVEDSCHLVGDIT